MPVCMGVHGCIDACMDVNMDVKVDGCKHGWRDVKVDGWMDVKVDIGYKID